MNCETVRETMSAELDGEATDEQLAPAYSHLAACADCRAWRREIIAVKGIFAALPEHPLPASIAGQLELAGTASPRVGRRNVYRIPRLLAWAAAAVVVLSIGWSSHQALTRPVTTSTAEVAETIVLTSRDRTSSSVMVRTTAETEREDKLPQNGGY